MSDAESGRPAKKARIESTAQDSRKDLQGKKPPKWHAQRVEYRRQQRRAELDHPQPESTAQRLDRELFGVEEDDESSLKLLDDEKKEKMRKVHMPQMFSQPSALAVGDKGILVTSDMGREKKCLIELADLVEDYLEQQGLIPAEQSDPYALLNSRLENERRSRVTRQVSGENSPVEEEAIDIEASVDAELSGMRSPHAGEPGSHQVHASPANTRQFQLITLDVQCLSFLRFIPNRTVHEKVNVTDLVYWICSEAAKNPGRTRSRHIKRLSPVAWLGKVLSNGLEKACSEVLPAHFQTQDDGERDGSDSATPEGGMNQGRSHGVTFAIKPTIRNSQQISRDDLIQTVAQKVQEMGKNEHRVDLKGYQKGILVNVYRGWIGMSVVDNAHNSDVSNAEKGEATDQKFGYEALKKYNLSEIYAEGMGKAT